MGNCSSCYPVTAGVAGEWGEGLGEGVVGVGCGLGL